MKVVLVNTGNSLQPILYIPHGSDESWLFSSSILSKICFFISHMVQMKVFHLPKFRLPFLPLYPTWFRWKRPWNHKPCRKDTLYIPHGSDERTMKLYELDNHKLLYIPHGSDERSKKFWVSKRRLNTLYPTWFRWKLSLDVKSSERFETLYPTWFRWKMYKKTKNAFGAEHLYIPHGSDERCLLVSLLGWVCHPLYPTWFRWKRASGNCHCQWCSFISHMVQMKVVWPVCP